MYTIRDLQLSESAVDAVKKSRKVVDDIVASDKGFTHTYIQEPMSSEEASNHLEWGLIPDMGVLCRGAVPVLL